MTQKASSIRQATSNRSATTIIQNMADAVSYLCGVATEAGLESIAVRLAGVRMTLQRMVAEQDATQTIDDGEQDERD